MSIRWVKTLAFLQRAFGLHPRPRRPMQHLARRSTHALNGLACPEESLRFRLALRQLRHDWDLMSEEASLHPDALRLQIRVLELSDDFPEADRLLRPNFEEAPLGRLFCAVIGQARQDGARDVVIAFSPESIRVSFDGHEAMTIPPTLDTPLRGILRFVEAADYGRLRRFLRGEATKVDGVSFAWSGSDRVTLTLEWV